MQVCILILLHFSFPSITSSLASNLILNRFDFDYEPGIYKLKNYLNQLKNLKRVKKLMFVCPGGPELSLDRTISNER